MPVIRPTLVLLTAIGCLSLATAAHADRDPTPEERQGIESALRDLGFTQWDDIEFDDDVWEIDDAHGADGRTYDLKLRPVTFEVIERKED